MRYNTSTVTVSLFMLFPCLYLAFLTTKPLSCSCSLQTIRLHSSLVFAAEAVQLNDLIWQAIYLTAHRCRWKNIILKEEAPDRNNAPWLGVGAVEKLIDRIRSSNGRTLVSFWLSHISDRCIDSIFSLIAYFYGDFTLPCVL